MASTTLNNVVTCNVSAYSHLKRIGMSNDLFEYAEMTSTPIVKEITVHCNSFTCAGTSTKKHGVPVYCGVERIETCPKCGQSSFLFYSEKFKRLLSFVAGER